MSRRFTSDFYLDVAAGKVAGHFVVNKFGENPLILAGATEDVWDGGGTYAFPTTATITHVRAAVDSAATQGLIIEVQGLDANWDLVIQSATLDPITSTVEVVLLTPLIRVFRIKVTADTVADQDIWAGATGVAAATAKAIVQLGNNQTLMAIYTVPNGMTAYMTQYYIGNVPSASRAPDSVSFRLWVADRDNAYEFQLKHSRSIPIAGNGINQLFKPYFTITQKSDIKISAEVVGGVGDDSHPHAGFDLIVVDNE